MKTATETPATDLGSLIVSTPGIVGGRARIRGRRVAVHRVAGWWQLGLSVEEIAEKLPSLTPAEIHAALAYYHLNRSEMERYLEEDRAAMASAPVDHRAA